jgi:hypothetical protein
MTWRGESISGHETVVSVADDEMSIQNVAILAMEKERAIVSRLRREMEAARDAYTSSRQEYERMIQEFLLTLPASEGMQALRKARKAREHALTAYIRASNFYDDSVRRTTLDDESDSCSTAQSTCSLRNLRP